MGGRVLEQGGTALAPLVYIVDDDADFREEVELGLSSLGFEVRGFPDAFALYRAYAVRPSAIVLLDIGLQGEDGLSIASHLRSSGSVGIVIVTARGSLDDRVDGLQKGADAYLVKPVELRELAATILALNQRLKMNSDTLVQPKWALLEGGWLLSDGLGHRLRLTRSEQLLLGRLFVERGATVDRLALAEALGGDVYEFNFGHLHTVASRLRRRAAKAGMELPLHAIRGQGFAFTD